MVQGELHNLSQLKANTNNFNCTNSQNM